jgi:hypothetical protein
MDEAHPLFPPLEQEYYLMLIIYLFKRGRNFERGRSPLSLKLPSPARKFYG